MIVMKFGGTSVENAEVIERVGDIVVGHLDQSPVVVVSALGGATDSLLAMSRAAASGSLRVALTQLRQLRHRHLAVLCALVSGPGQTAVRNDIQGLLDLVQN